MLHDTHYAQNNTFSSITLSCSTHSLFNSQILPQVTNDLMYQVSDFVSSKRFPKRLHRHVLRDERNDIFKHINIHHSPRSLSESVHEK